MERKKISVIFADASELLHHGITAILGGDRQIDLIAMAFDGQRLMDLAATHHPDVILINVQLPLIDGIEVARLVSEKYPQIAILALSASDDDHLIAGMIEGGAMGYLMKNATSHEIIGAIKMVSRNDAYFCKEAAAKLPPGFSPGGRGKKHRHHGLISFTKKEKMIIDLICNEYSTKEIASILNVGSRTIEGHRERLLQKTGCQNTAGLVVYAIKCNIFSP